MPLEDVMKQRIIVSVGKAFLGDYVVMVNRYDDVNHTRYCTEVAEFKKEEDAKYFIAAVKNLLSISAGKMLDNFKPEEVADFESTEDSNMFLKCVKNLIQLNKPKNINCVFRD